MASIALGLFILAIAYVVVWSIRNDGLRSIRDQNGYLKMLAPRQTPAAKTKRSYISAPQAQAAGVESGEEPARPPADTRPGG